LIEYLAVDIHQNTRLVLIDRDSYYLELLEDEI